MERLREIGCDIYYTMYGGQITLEMGEENEEDEGKTKGLSVIAHHRGMRSGWQKMLL